MLGTRESSVNSCQTKKSKAILSSLDYPVSKPLFAPAHRAWRLAPAGGRGDCPAKGRRDCPERGAEDGQSFELNKRHASKATHSPRIYRIDRRKHPFRRRQPGPGSADFG